MRRLRFALGLLLCATSAGAQTSRAEQPDTEIWAGLPVVGGRLLVAWQPTTALATRTALHAELRAASLRALDDGLELVDIGEVSVGAALAAYMARPEVAFVEPDVLFQPTSAPDDPKWSLQWGLEVVGAAQAWEGWTGDPSCVLAILDSGVRTDHDDLAAHLAWGWDAYDGDEDPSDTNGHGTHCAGIAAALTDNGLGVAGAAHSCRFAAYRCGDGSFPLSALVAAVHDARERGAHVLSMSWGSSWNSPSLRTALDAAAAAGCVLVAAAGNDGSTAKFYPAALPAVIGVASSTPTDGRSPFSNHGAWVSVAAPGQSIYSTWHTGGYAYLSGTSMACPLVAGLAGLLYSALGGERSPAAAALVRAAIEDSGLDVGSWVAHGRVDFAAALAALGAAAPPVLSHLEPAALAALGGSLTVAGTGLLGVTEARVGGASTPFESLGDGALRLDVLPQPALGPVSISVVEQGVPSASLPLQILPTVPPVLLVDSHVSPGDTLHWSFGAHPGHHWLLVAAGSPNTLPVQGSLVLADLVPLLGGLLDGAGLGQLAVLVPPSLGGITIFWQILSGPGWLQSASNVAATTFG